MGLLGAHPRACGENGGDPDNLYTGDGSSPRVRGKPATRPRTAWCGGLIPARAGKTGSSGAAGSTGAAHPRACGENGNDLHGAGWVPGSSPRVRGKLLQLQRLRNRSRLIPARAGKTVAETLPPLRSTAHPRACGENCRVEVSCGSCGGSSPRVRGKHLVQPVRRDQHRLIPARAGKTRSKPSTCTGPPAHPRACGENVTVPHAETHPHGSSPRVRGKRFVQVLNEVPQGLIPARAGKTQGLRGQPEHCTAHPRACGENGVSCFDRLSRSGSSPRVRGKHPIRSALADNLRLIPARAGKTDARTVAYIRFGAHPRACGENVDHVIKPIGDAGSSPRVRGKQDVKLHDLTGPGLIPARAGKTGGRPWRSRRPRAHPRACGENRM